MRFETPDPIDRYNAERLNWLIRKSVRPNPHRTREATSKEKRSNLRARRVPRPVWIGPKESCSLKRDSNSEGTNVNNEKSERS